MADEPVARIAASLASVRAALPLAHDGQTGAQQAVARAKVSRVASRHRPHWSPAVLAGVVVAAAGAGVAGATVIAHPGSSLVHDFFWNPPEKGANGGVVSRSPSEAPHDLVATVPLPDGRHASIYATSGDGREGPNCVLVEVTPADGSGDVGQGTCGDGPRVSKSALVWPMSGILLGSVPNRSISHVQVTLDGRTLELPVVDQYFAFAPPGAEAATAVVGAGQIVGFDSAGAPDGTWSFSLPYAGGS